MKNVMRTYRIYTLDRLGRFTIYVGNARAMNRIQAVGLMRSVRPHTYLLAKRWRN